jgi:hypothetical protein
MGADQSHPKNQGMKKNVAVLGAALGLGLTLTSCGMSFGLGMEQSEEIAYDVTDKVAIVQADTGSGDIVVNESDRAGVRVVETLHWRGDKPGDGHRVEGDTLSLDYECHTCAVDYRLEIPRGMDVRLDTGSGMITLRSLTGAVAASTGSGDVDASGLTAKRVKAETGSGSISLRFSAAPDHVDVQSGSGDSRVWVPSGAYNVETETGSGDQEVQVTRDPGAPRTLIVKTGAGDAKVLRA